MLAGNWKSQMLTIFCGLFFISFAVITSVSRVTDDRHFWWDVLVGDILGIGQVALTTFVDKDHFKWFFYETHITYSTYKTKWFFVNKLLPPWLVLFHAHTKCNIGIEKRWLTQQIFQQISWKSLDSPKSQALASNSIFFAVCIHCLCDLL